MVEENNLESFEIDEKAVAYCQSAIEQEAVITHFFFVLGSSHFQSQNRLKDHGCKPLLLQPKNFGIQKTLHFDTETMMNRIEVSFFYSWKE